MAAKTARSLDELLDLLAYRASWLEDEFKNCRLRAEVRGEIEGLRRNVEEARRERNNELDELLAEVRGVKAVLADALEAGVADAKDKSKPTLTVIEGGNDA